MTNVVVVKPKKKLLDNMGSVKTDKPPLTGEQIHEFVAQAVADEVVSGLKKEE